MKNFATRKYIPIFERMEETTCYSRKFGVPDQVVMVPKFKHGVSDNFIYYTWRLTTKPKLTYTVMRIRSRRNGQMELIPILKPKPLSKSKIRTTRDSKYVRSTMV